MEVVITVKHSNVFYINKRLDDGEYGFEAVEKAKACKNEFGLDLFQYRSAVYEGRTGVRMLMESELPNLATVIDRNGGLPKLNELIEAQLSKTGESPRYTRPDERKKDIFPPDPAKENIVFGKDSYGEKHYFFRFEYEGYELYTLKNAKDYFRQVYVECNGYMLAIDQHHRLEEVKKWLDGLKNGVKGEVEKWFNESMEHPGRWADIGFANILGRREEADAHNAPIREARERERQQREAEREAERIAEEQAEKAEYEQAIKTAEDKILNKQTVLNADIHGKSLIMQLFREHEITVPLKPQGWIISALHSIEYKADREDWSYRYYNKSRDSTVFCDYLPLLVSAVQTKQQFEEMNCPLDGDTENDCADCAYAGDYRFQDGECVQRDDENDMEI